MTPAKGKRDRPPLPVKGVRVRLDPAWPPGRALRELVRGCLVQLEANTPHAGGARSGECLHQARISLRRMRSALRLASREGPQVDSLRDELGRLSEILGAARDWDVFIATAPAHPQAAHVLKAARRKRTLALSRVRAALRSKRHKALLAEVGLWIETLPARSWLRTSLPDYAPRLLRKLHKRLLRDAAGLQGGTPEERHSVRIDAKHLRYAVEFFGTLYPPGEVRRYLRLVVALQDALGALNDAATARRLLAELSVGDTTAALIGTTSEATDARNLAVACEAIETLSGYARFWKKSPRHGGHQ